MIQNFINIQKYLFFLIPLVLITGPFLPDLFISVIGILFLINKYLKRELDFRKIDFYGKAFFFWCIYLFCISIFSRDPLLSLESSLFFFRFGVFAYAVSELVSDRDNLIKFFQVTIASIFLVIIDGFIQYFLGFNLFGIQYDSYRMVSIGNDYFVGHYLVRMIPIVFAITLLFFHDHKKLVFLIMILFITADVLIFLSGERTSFFMMILFTFLIIISLSRWKLIRIISALIAIIIITLLLNSDNSIKLRMVNQTINQTESSVTFSPEHDLLYESAYNMFLDNPLFGVGPKIFRLRCSDLEYGKDIFGHKKKITTWSDNKSCNTHPHNYYLQLLSETGIIGTLPVILFLFLILTLIIKHLYAYYISQKIFLTDYILCLLISVLVQLWPIMPHMSFFSNRTNVFLFLTLGLIMAYRNLKKNI